MTQVALAELVAEIAQRERKLAVQEGNYLWALICAFVEDQAKQF